MQVPASGQMLPFHVVAELASELVGHPPDGVTMFATISVLLESHVVLPRYRL